MRTSALALCPVVGMSLLHTGWAEKARLERVLNLEEQAEATTLCPGDAVSLLQSAKKEKARLESVMHPFEQLKERLAATVWAHPPTQPTLFKVAGLTGAAALLKVSLGSDDLVWLAPFVAREKTRLQKAWVVMLYALSVAGLVSIAACIGLLTNTMTGRQTAELKWWLNMIAGCLLFLFSIHLAYEDGWLKPCGLAPSDDDKDGETDEAAPEGGNPECESPSRGMRRGIVVVAILGSLDDFTVYLTMASTGVYTWYELLLGTVLGCLMLASIVLLAAESSSLSHIMERIPAWAILLALSLVVFSHLLWPGNGHAVGPGDIRLDRESARP